MKRFLPLILITLLLISPAQAVARPPDFCGGVNNEYQYEEVVFLSGEPIKFIGTLDVSERERGDQNTLTYKFRLQPEDKSIDGRLDRQMSYEIGYTRRNDKGQTLADTTVKTYRETISFGKDRYTLADYQISKSDVIDNRPASDFYSGTITARKYYEINRNQGTAIVEISGGCVGYNNFWGGTETQMLDYIIQVDRELPPDKDQEEEGPRHTSWQGTVKVNSSDSMSKTLKYSDNQASLSSFPGGHMRITNRDMYSSYQYDLPRMVAGVAGNRRNQGIKELNQQMLPRIERLVIPKFRDIGGHWAEEDIKKLYSLDVFSGSDQFFAPDVAMTRLEFAMAVIKACDIRVQEEKINSSRARRGETVKISPFQDVSVSHPGFDYVNQAVNKGIISGVSDQRFMPNQPLTRAQAITILIRALGFENRAPTPGYFTWFSDDYEIPNWAKDSIYVAREINLIQGDNANRINPNQVMTRAEASVMLVKFLNFLERDLQKDYREDIVLYN